MTKTLKRHRAATMRKRSAGQSELISGGFARIVVAIAILAGIGYALSEIMSATSDQTEAEIENIQTLVSKQYGNSGTFFGLTSQSLIASGHLPSNYYSGEQIVTPWHGVIVLGPTTNSVTYVNNGAWILGMTNVPSGICNDIAIKRYQTQIGVAIGTGSPGQIGFPTTGSALVSSGLTFTPPTPAQAVQYCQGNTAQQSSENSSPGLASIVLTFGN